MKTTRSDTRPIDGSTLTRDGDTPRGRLSRGLSRTVDAASRAAADVIDRLPGSVDTVRTGASDTTTALQALPDPTLRWMAATSVGLSAGLYLAGVPRVVIAAALTPALLLGAAIVGRPRGYPVPA